MALVSSPLPPPPKKKNVHQLLNESMTMTAKMGRRRSTITAAASNMQGYVFVTNKAVGLKGKGWSMVWASFHGRSGHIRLLKDEKVG